MHGVLLEKIKEWLGHSDIETTKRYAHLNVSMAKQEVAEIMKEVSCFETYKTSRQNKKHSIRILCFLLKSKSKCVITILILMLWCG